MANVGILLISLLTLMLVVPPSEGGWFHGRRRRGGGGGCSARHCEWSQWGRWSECDRNCGNKGRQYRSRGKAQTESCGGQHCSGDSEEEKPCNRMCFNGGFLRYDGLCHCLKQYYGNCCEHHHPTPTPTRDSSRRGTDHSSRRSYYGKNTLQMSWKITITYVTFYVN